jgi:glycosyltransferase involved in cell wall biosynthesis
MKINYAAPANFLGYGVVGFNIFKQLIKLGQDVKIFPIGNIEPSMVSDIEPYWWGNQIGSGHSASVRIFHQNDVHSRIGPGIHYGFPIFELDMFSKPELVSMNLCDELIVCSEWARNIVKEHLDITTHVVPLGIDPNIFFPCNLPSTTQTIFLSVGKWEIRKGHDFTIDSFNKAFNSSDNVELWMMCDNPFLRDGGKEWVNKCRTSKLSSKIKIIPRQSTHENVYYIMSKADIGLFPARAEGWNLELLEMMSMGKQVITTNYSAHTEFCNKENSHLINISSKELAFDGIWFHNNGNWAHLGANEQEQYINYLRALHQDKQNKNLRINQAGIDTGKKYTWENSAKTLIKALE